ncbi:MAG: nitroreductase family protein [Synergistaceae bacterium]|jgi:nitroreductase|nr:nitroreductase family protein [Synergistaceae bacterium]
MSNQVLQAISDRRSIRGYKASPLSKEQTDIILKAAVESPSALNAQPWHFSVVTNQNLIREINAEAVKNLALDIDDIFFAAPLVIFISTDADSRWGRLDSGIAVENMALAAHAIGLGSVILGLPDAAFTGPPGERFNILLKFPPKHTFAVAIAIGVPTETKEAHPIEPDRIDYIN